MADVELVVKIPEKTYMWALDEVEKEFIIHNIIYNAIANGTPLPKGHGDLIDKGKLKKWIETQDGDKLMTEYYLDALDMQEPIVGGSHDEDID